MTAARKTGMQGTDWLDHAACRTVDPEIFFRHPTEDQSEAIAVCTTCPVSERCRAGAVNRGERFGVWGGLVWDGISERERRRRCAQEAGAT